MCEEFGNPNDIALSALDLPNNSNIVSRLKTNHILQSSIAILLIVILVSCIGILSLEIATYYRATQIKYYTGETFIESEGEIWEVPE